MAALPRTVELLWGLDAAGSRGPRRGLSLDQVLDAAMAVADDEGFAGLSMSKVAKRLGFTTMSLYRYVDNKDMLIELIMDRAIGPAPQIPPGTPWRAALEQWAWSEFHQAAAHPWWTDIPVFAPRGPNNAAWLESALSAFSGTRLSEPLKLQLVLNLSMYVIGRLRLKREIESRPEEDYDASMSRVIDPGRFPALSAVFAAQSFESQGIHWADADFAFGLDRLLDGFEHFIDGEE
ncbi:TetR/AcrR family transcriptional regulator [Nocardia thraciensis]